MESAGKCTFIQDSQVPYIEIKIRDERVTEDVVSHELLHALYIKRGFGFTRHNTIGDIPFQGITELLHSIIEHKSIYEIQKGMGIDTVEAQKHKANTIFKGAAKEDSKEDPVTYGTVVNSLLLLECLIGAKEYEELYIERIRTCFNHEYELAKKLEIELFSKDIDNAEIFRKTFIKGLRIFDEYLSKHMLKSIPHFKLTENISISFIPSEYQLQLKAEQVFDFKESINSFILLSIKDNQASYILEKSNNIATLKNMTVEELIGRIDGLITIRTK